MLPGQVVFLPPGTFGSYLFAQALRASGNRADVAFAETGTLPNLVRKHGNDSIVISAYGKHLPTGVFPARSTERAIKVLQAAYPGVQPLEDVLCRVTDSLDAERMAIREGLGYGPPHFPLRDHYAKDGPEWMYSRAAHDKLTSSGDWREKIDLLSHRYMVEDTKLGLSLLASIGKWAGVDAPIGRGMLAIASAILGDDLYRTGRSLEALGLATLTRGEMAQLLREGL